MRRTYQCVQEIVNPTVHDGQGIREENSFGNIDSMDEDALASKLEGALTNKRYGTKKKAHQSPTVIYFLFQE